jgi:hypothetical protein
MKLRGIRLDGQSEATLNDPTDRSEFMARRVDDGCIRIRYLADETNCFITVFIRQLYLNWHA